MGQERPDREEYENQQHDAGTKRLHNQQPEILRDNYHQEQEEYLLDLKIIS